MTWDFQTGRMEIQSMSVAKTSSVQVWVAVVREVNHGPFEPHFRHLPIRLNK